MSQPKTIIKALDACKQQIQLFLEKLYTLDIEKLDNSQRLKVLVFYEQLMDLLYSSTPIFDFDVPATTSKTPKA